jgi:hypothetical protein
MAQKPEAPAPKYHPSILAAKAKMEKRRLALIAKRDTINREIALLDASLLPWEPEQ